MLQRILISAIEGIRQSRGVLTRIRERFRGQQMEIAHVGFRSIACHHADDFPSDCVEQEVVPRVVALNALTVRFGNEICVQVEGKFEPKLIHRKISI